MSLENHMDIVPMVIGPIFSLEMDTEKPVDSPPLTYLGCCELSVLKNRALCAP